MNLRRLMIEKEPKEPKVVDYLPYHRLYHFKDLKFKFEHFAHNHTSYLSTEIGEIEYLVEKQHRQFRSMFSSTPTIEVVVEMLSDLEEKVLKTKVVIPSEFGDYNLIISKLFERPRNEYSIGVNVSPLDSERMVSMIRYRLAQDGSEVSSPYFV